VLLGRPRKLTPHQTREALRRVESGEPLREIALSYAVDHSTISWLKARHAADDHGPRRVQPSTRFNTDFGRAQNAAIHYSQAVQNEDLEADNGGHLNEP
jgi:hypothetical protein